MRIGVLEYIVRHDGRNVPRLAPSSFSVVGKIPHLENPQ
jgi:hypothetical protein